MPEGPEIHFLAKHIQKIKHKKLLAIHGVRLPSASFVKKISAVGKYIILDCGSYFVHMHMGLTGWLYFKKQKYTKYVLEFSDGVCLYLDDARKFAKIRVYGLREHERALDKIGVDVLSKKYTLEYFKEALKNTNRNVSAFLLDQSVNAGIGNYVRNDALYVARIHPGLRTGDLSDTEIRQLYRAIVGVVHDSYNRQMRGDEYRFKVYGRKVDRLGNKVTYTSIGGRGTYYVASLQVK